MPDSAVTIGVTTGMAKAPAATTMPMAVPLELLKYFPAIETIVGHTAPIPNPRHVALMNTRIEFPETKQSI